MGGNALKDVVTRRYARAEYLELEKQVVDKLRRLFPDSWVDPIEAYSEKENFGDLDIVLSSDNLPPNWVQLVGDCLMSKQIVKNGNVCSFEHHEFQVDVILTPTKDYAVALDYYAFNDLGNLLGRVARSMGLKLGHTGLSYNWSVGTHLVRQFSVRSNWDAALDILGYDRAVYRKGFTTMESIFEFVASGKFFSPDIYLLHNRNHASRVRDSKRESYMWFLRWCEDNAARLSNYPKQTPEHWVDYLKREVMGFAVNYDKVAAEWGREQQFKARYNGRVVADATGLPANKELGVFMAWIRNNTEGLQARVLAMTEVEIAAYLKQRHAAYTEQV